MNPLTKHIQEIKSKYTADQVLRKFGVTISNGKALCLWHSETQPSLVVYEDAVKCFGCGKFLNTFDLAHELLQRQTYQVIDIFDVVRWFNSEDFSIFPPGQHLKSAEYLGPVDQGLIDYWHSCLTPEHYARLLNERLLEDFVVDEYLIGYDPYRRGFSIPFWSGLPRRSDVEIVQFRLDDNEPKYIGMAGHNRPSVMNQHLLSVPQPYLVVVFGTFDPVLAWYGDGVRMVGLNGATAWQSNPERLKELFKLQHNIIVVPDKTPTEYAAALWTAQQVGGRVAYWLDDLPFGTDYIKYRLLGNSAKDFERLVSKTRPLASVNYAVILDIWNVLLSGNAVRDVHVTEEEQSDVVIDFHRSDVDLKCAPAVMRVMRDISLDFYARLEIAQALVQKEIHNGTTSN